MTRIVSVKDRLQAWATEQDQLDTVSAYILYRLAQFADADCRAWSAVKTLAAIVRVSERTVQYRLREMEEGGLIAPTGATHRLEGTTRSVPIYQLAPDIDGLGLPESMGANSAPMEEGHGCNQAAPMDGPMGAENAGYGCSLLHPHGTEGTDQFASLTEGARAGETDVERWTKFEACEAAYPCRGLGNTDREAAWLAFQALTDTGEATADRLIAAAAGFGADPDTKRRTWAPIGLHKFLGQGRWRGFGDPAALAGGGKLVARWPGPAEIRAAVVAAEGADFAGSWLDRSDWDAERGAIVTRTGIAVDRLRQVLGASAMASLGIKLIERAAL